MNLKPFEIKGVIKLVQRRIFVNDDECYGTAIGEGRRFAISLSNIAIETVEEFKDAVAHELLHIYLFILMAALKVKMSDAAHHRIIEPTVRGLVRRVNGELRRKRNRL